MNRIVSLCLSLFILLTCTAGVSAQTQGDDLKQVLLEIQELAKKGELRGCPFPIGASGDTVFDKWGVIDPLDWGTIGVTPTSTTYEYTEKNTTIVLDSNKKIQWISGWLPFKGEVTSAQIKEIFGEPKEDNPYFLVYEFGKNKLLFSLGDSEGIPEKQTSLHLFSSELMY